MDFVRIRNFRHININSSGDRPVLNTGTEFREQPSLRELNRMKERRRISTFWDTLFGFRYIVCSGAFKLEISYIDVRKSLLDLGNKALWLRVPQDNEHMLAVRSTAH
jgi:hypothetical protein